MADLKSNEAKSGEGDVKPLAKPAKITKKDWKKVETWLKNELELRKRSEHRVKAEAKWREIDRQIAMEVMVKLNRDGTQADTGWHNVFELGELSKAAEDIKADVRRIIFPQARAWFDAHSEVQAPLDPATGKPKISTSLQTAVDGRVRAFMQQQHSDFGFYDAVEISIGEALYHGSFCAEARVRDQQLIYDGTKRRTRTAPTWVPHSMWNTWPDPSPANIGTDMYYEGSIYIESYMPRHRAEQLVKKGGEGWMPSQWSKVAKDEHVVRNPSGDTRTKDVKLTTYWGDVVIERDDGDLYFPNHKAVLMNSTICYFSPNETPYPPIIYKGYERTDVRDPYYLSPIIKMSPMQKLSTMLANKAMDGIELKLEPPIVYDGNDPDFVLNGGPDVSPGSKTSTKGSNAFSQVEIGDPATAVSFLQFCMQEMRDKLGRPMNKKPASDRKTAAEVNKADQDEEVSLVGFIDRMEEALRSFLYMQHQMNLTHATEYTYYSPEMEDPDFLRMTKDMLPKNVHFEVVGARGVLGEQARMQHMSVTTAFLAGNPLFAPLLNAKQIALTMYQDAGVKNPEHLLVQQGNVDPAQMMVQLQQAKQMLQKLGGLLQQEKQKSAVKMAKIQSDAVAKEAKTKSDAALKHEKNMLDFAAKQEKLHQDGQIAMRGIVQEMRDAMMGHALERDKHHNDMTVRLLTSTAGMKKNEAERTVKGDDTETPELKAVSEVKEAVVKIEKGQEEISRTMADISDTLENVSAYLAAGKRVKREGANLIIETEGFEGMAKVVEKDGSGKIVGLKPRLN